MSRPLARAARLLSLVVAFAVGVGAFGVVTNLGWLSPFGIGSESRDSQVINAIERTQEVSLLSLGVQGIMEQNQCAEAFGKCIPGSTETDFIQYEFDAKLGLDGAGVGVSKTGDHAYRVSVPDFGFIGYDEPTFKLATEDNGVLTWITPDIDQLDMVNRILDDEAQAEYISSNEDLLADQTKVFYDSLITSVDPDAVTTYEFS